MGNMFFCEVTRKNPEVPIGIYAIQDTGRGRYRYHGRATRVWKQGPRGGVKIIKNDFWELQGKYVTKDEKMMQEFMWVKLQAQMII